MRGLLGAIVVVGLTLAGCSLPTRPDPPPPSPTPAMRSAVYYVAADYRLMREFHELPEWDGTPVAQVRSAVTEMLRADTAKDPDYGTPWPGATRLDAVALDGGTVTIDLSGAADHAADAATAGIAVQQLVWTATAVPGVTAVNLFMQRRQDPLWGIVDISQPLKRAPAVDVLAPVWLISPQHGDRVGREVTLHIAGVAFEATVNYAVRRGGVVVAQGFVTLNQGAPAQGEATEKVTLAPGEYVIEAFVISSESGERQFVDNHTVTVV